MRIIAQTPRLIIRAFAPQDEEPYIAMLMDPVVNVHLPKRTEEENRRMFHESMAGDVALNRWSMIDSDNNTFAGMCLLRQYTDEHAGILELGYSLPQNYWGKGLATEMAQALVAYARTLPQAQKLVAVTTPANITSQLVLTKAGFMAQGQVVRGGETLAYFELEINQD